MIRFYIKKFLIEHNFLSCILICMIVFALSVIIIYRDDIFRKKGNDDFNHQYEINEVINIETNDESIIRYILDDYLNKCTNSIDTCYKLLATDFKKEYYPTIEDFKDYLKKNTNTFFNPSLYKYSIREDNDGYKYYRIRTTENTYYIFKEKSVLNYEVYLDYMYY